MNRPPDHSLHFSTAIFLGLLRGVCQSPRHSPGGEMTKTARFTDLPPPLTTSSPQELRAAVPSLRCWSARGPKWVPDPVHAPRQAHLVSAGLVARRRRRKLRAFCQRTYLVLALGVLCCLHPLFSPVNHRTVLSALAPPGRGGGVKPV